MLELKCKDLIAPSLIHLLCRKNIAALRGCARNLGLESLTGYELEALVGKTSGVQHFRVGLHFRKDRIVFALSPVQVAKRCEDPEADSSLLLCALLSRHDVSALYNCIYIWSPPPHELPRGVLYGKTQ